MSELQDFVFRNDSEKMCIEGIGELAFSERKPVSVEFLGKRDCAAKIEHNLSKLHPIEFSRDHTRKIHSINLAKAKELESKMPKVKKKMHISFQTFDIRNPKFTRHLQKEDFFNQKPRMLGKYGEMGSYDFEDEERSIEKKNIKAQELQIRNKQRKGESFYIHREETIRVDANRKLSMMVSSGNFENSLAESNCT